MTRATLIGSLVFSLASCALLVASGCNLVSAGSYILEGPGKIDAEYELRQVKTVVFVDDQKNVLPRTALRVIIGDDISARLLTEELVRDLTISLLRDVNREELTTTTGRRKLEEALSTEIADDVAKLFYQHERLNLGEKVNSDR